MRINNDTLTFTAYMERLPRTTEIFSDRHRKLVVYLPTEYKMGWISLSQYARYLQKENPLKTWKLSTPDCVLHACLELVATT